MERWWRDFPWSSSFWSVYCVMMLFNHEPLALYKTLLVAHSEQLNVREWEEKGATKVVIKGESAEHLIALKQTADSQGIRNFLVADAGKSSDLLL